MTSYLDEHMNKREAENNRIEQEGDFHGWRVPVEKPFKSVGKFSDVIGALNKVKSAVPHCKKS